MKTKRLCRIVQGSAALLLLAGFLSAMAGAQTGTAPQYPDKSKLLVYRDKDGEEHKVKTPADWKIRRQHILDNMLLVMGPVPDTKKVPLDVKVIEEEKTDKYVRKLISFATDKTDRLSAYLFIPKGIK